jgi:hypothetical protein
MSGNVVGGIIGATIGYFVTGGSPLGALKGYAIGSMVGGLLMPTDLPPTYGPRLSDLSIQASEYGSPIPIVYGTAAMQGSIIWASDLVEVATETDAGGKGGGSQTQTSYAYFGNFAVLVSEGPVSGIGRIWAGPAKRLIWDGARLESGTMRVYLGDESQEPDPLMEQYEGAGNVPAYRGCCYIVFENFALEKDGNMLPFLSIEVGAADTCPAPASSVTVGGSTYSIFDPAPVKVADIPATVAQYERVFADATTGLIYYVYQDTGAHWWLASADPAGAASPPPLALGNGGSRRSAWNNRGGAVVIVANSPDQYVIDLRTWTIGGPTTAINGVVCSGLTCASIPIDLADVVWSDAEGAYRYLSMENSINGTSVGVFAIEPADTVAARGGAAPVNWGAAGARVGGDLLPLSGGTAAASFSPFSNHANVTGIEWGAYDPTRRLLVDFNAGAYADLITGEFHTAVGFGASTTAGQAVYSVAADRFFAIQGGAILTYDPAKLTPDGWPPDTCVLYPATAQAYASGEPIPVNFRIRLFLLPNEPDYLGVLTGGGDIMKIRLPRTRAQGVALSAVVADLSERAGESRYNVAALAADTVDGYVIARPTQVRAAIDALRSAYYFDAVESQGVIRFVKRGGPVVTAIDDADLAAREGAGGEPPDPLKTTRRMESELPRAVNVKYVLAATDYGAAAKQARRLIGSSGDEQTIDAPLVLTDTKAQQMAEVILHGAWVERLAYSFAIPRKYSYLEPTDLVTVRGHLMRLTSVKATAHGVLECEALADETSYYAPHVVVTETQPPPPPGVALPAATSLELF